MLIASALSGIWAGVPLAWQQSDRLDETRYAADIERCFGAAASGVYADGSTGEFYVLDFDEFQQMSHVMTAVTRGRGAPYQSLRSKPRWNSHSAGWRP